MVSRALKLNYPRCNMKTADLYSTTNVKVRSTIPERRILPSSRMAIMLALFLKGKKDADNKHGNKKKVSKRSAT